MPLPSTLPFTLGGPGAAPSSTESSTPPDWTTAVPSTPGVHPTGTEQTAFTRPEFLNNLPNFVAQFLENTVGAVVKAILGIFIPGDIGSAFSQLSNWANVLLPTQIKAPIGQLVQLLITALNLIPIFGPLVGDSIEYLAGIFGLLDDNTAAAQATGGNAQVGVAQLSAQLAGGAVTGGGVFTDTFDRTGATLGSDYSQSDTGPAGGTLATNGSSAYVTPTGTSVTSCFARVTTALATDYQSVSFVQDSAMGNIIAPCQLDLLLRCDSTLDNFVIASIGWDFVAIGIVVAGSYTALASVGESNNTDDTWTFRAGTGANVREFTLTHNNAKVDFGGPVIDTGGTSVVGASNRYAGFEAETGLSAFFFGTVQVAPPELKSIAVNDRLATEGV